MNNILIVQIKMRIQELDVNSAVNPPVYQKGVMDGLRIALEIVEGADEPVAFTKMQRKIHFFYESHGIFSRIRRLKSEGFSGYAIANQLNLEKVPTFHGKTWNQTQVARILKSLVTVTGEI